MNKNISVWRGFKEPPTKYHVWIDEKNNVNLWDGTGWKTIADGKNYADIVEHLESFPKIDIVNEIPNGSDFKNGDFLLYKLGKDITISYPECYDFGKTTSFTIKEGDLCLIGKIKHTPTSSEAEHPKFSDKYKYKIRFDANLDYYFGGVENIGEPVLTTTTQPLTYSLIGSEDKCIIKCGNYYAFISGERLCLTDLLSYANYFVLHELEPNKFELLNYSSQSSALNAYQGLGTAGDYSDEIRWYNAGRPGNIILFLPQESELIVKKIIYTTQEATTSYSGLMSKEDKSKLNSIARNANNYSLPAASSSTRGGIKVGYTSSSANNRAVQLSSEKAYVNIPDATTSQAGLMTSSDKEKLDDIIGVKWSILKRDITGDIVYRTSDNIIKSIQPSKWNSNLGQPIGIVAMPGNRTIVLGLEVNTVGITGSSPYLYYEQEFINHIKDTYDIQIYDMLPSINSLENNFKNLDFNNLNNTLNILGKSNMPSKVFSSLSTLLPGHGYSYTTYDLSSKMVGSYVVASPINVNYVFFFETVILN